nr:tetratricopeptide repeat protein [Agromyces seonyuensis]
MADGHPIAHFEVGGSFDSTGDAATAVEHYRAALAAGLEPDRRRQCVIQLASSLRNLGEADHAVQLLTDELAHAEEPHEAQLRAFLALALADAGREREAVGLAVGAVGSLVERYRRSLTAYGAELAGEAFPPALPVVE